MTKSMFKKFQGNSIWVRKFDGLEGSIVKVIVMNHFVLASSI